MLKGPQLALTLVLAAALAGVAYSGMAYKHNKIVSCYYASWAFYRPGNGKYDVDDIDPTLCTHGFYGFADLDNKTWEMKPYDPWFDQAPGDCEPGYCNYDGFRRFVALKEKNPAFVPMLSVGGWNAGSGKYSVMAADPVKRGIFIDTSIALMKRYGFEGLDLDWEYPGYKDSGGQVSIDKDDLNLLVQEFSQKLKAEGMLLTMAMACGFDKLTVAYDVPFIMQYLDFANIMGYDYHGWWPGHEFTGHNSPLQNRVEENDPDAPGYLYSLKDTVDIYIYLGMPIDKMVLGVPTYGRGWTLVDNDYNGLYCPADGGFPPGPYTRQWGTIGYNEVLECFYNETLWNLPGALPGLENWNIVVDDCYKSPYMYQGRYWMSYDDPESIRWKTKYANWIGTIGVMIWSMETDDFTGDNSPHTYPLLRAINEVLESGEQYDPHPDYETCGSAPFCDVDWIKTTTTTTTTTTPSGETTTRPTGVTCVGAEEHKNYEYPGDCHKYYRCEKGAGGELEAVIYNCGPGHAFDPNDEACIDLSLNPTLCD